MAKFHSNLQLTCARSQENRRSPKSVITLIVRRKVVAGIHRTVGLCSPWLRGCLTCEVSAARSFEMMEMMLLLEWNHRILLKIYLKSVFSESDSGSIGRWKEKWVNWHLAVGDMYITW